MSSQVTGTVANDNSSGGFGANEWLVDEMYERYLSDKNSVDRSWWPILESYRPSSPDSPVTASPVTASPVTASPVTASP
ncbi:MAG: hypothetical protein H7248_03750, partial [Microbacteriaceae bacterium]|nr:hypothetical protein [Microbacteriaceae bacterium]